MQLMKFKIVLKTIWKPALWGKISDACSFCLFVCFVLFCFVLFFLFLKLKWILLRKTFRKKINLIADFSLFSVSIKYNMQFATRFLLSQFIFIPAKDNEYMNRQYVEINRTYWWKMFKQKSSIFMWLTGNWMCIHHWFHWLVWQKLC